MSTAELVYEIRRRTEIYKNELNMIANEIEIRLMQAREE